MNSGIYNLIVKLNKKSILSIGKLGKFTFPKGCYVYTGSSKKNLSQRIERHKRRHDKKLKWHIDFLLNSEYAKVVDISIFENPEYDECSLNRTILNNKGAEIIVKGFGSSDCKNGCPAHLIFFKNINKKSLKYDIHTNIHKAL